MGSAFSLDGKISLDSRDFVKGSKQASVAIGDVDEGVEEVPDTLDLDASGFVSGAGKADKAINEVDASTKAADDSIDLDASGYIAGADRAEKQIDSLDASTKGMDESIDLDASGFVKGTDKASAAIGDVESDMDGLEDSAGKSGGSAGDALGSALASGFAAVGVGALIATALNEAMNIEAGLDRVTAQFALTADEAQRYGQLGGDLYAAAWGDSIEETTRVIAEVGRSLQEVGDIADEELGSIGERVIAVADTFDQDFDAVIRSTGQLLRNDLAPDAEAALDLIVVAFQEGGDRAQDLLDTIDEYAQHWDKLGIDGDEALGLIAEGFRQGFRDGDKLADLFKEFGLRVLEADAIAAFDALGLVGTSMQTAFGEGGEAARAALGDTIRALADIKDPLEQNRIAIQLFGTQWEDLGPKAIDVLETIDTGLGEVEGAAQDVADTVADNTAASFEELKRRGMEILTDLAGGFLALQGAAQSFADGDYSGSANELETAWAAIAGLPIFTETAAMWDRGPGALIAGLNSTRPGVDNLNGSLGETILALDDVSVETIRFAEIAAGAEAASDDLGDSLGETAEQAEDAEKAMADLFDITNDLAGSENDAEEATWAMNDAIEDFTTTAGTAEAGSREYEQALNDAEESVLSQAQAQADLEIAQRTANGEVLTATDKQGIYRDKLSATSEFLDGPLKHSIDGHVSNLDKIPLDKSTVITAVADTQAASLAMQALIDRSWSATVQLIPTTGHTVRRASGGPIEPGDVYTVGEQGTELFVSDRAGHIVDATSTAALLAPSVGAVPSVHSSAVSGVQGDVGGSRVTLNLMDRWQVEAVVSQRDAELLQSLEAGLR